jgi:RHS repeat-associated protein
LNEDRIATKYNSEGNDNTGAEKERTYYYHSDHLGSAQVVTNWKGQIHERLEYTPYGELWIDWKGDSALEDSTPFRFTGKEMDAETGFYYYGARYLDPKTSRWISADPALGDYVPSAPVNEEAKKRNGNLPGMGGVFNYVNLHVYHYAGNNPVKYTDPDGRDIILLIDPDRAPLSAMVTWIPFGDKITFGHSAVLIGNDKDGWIFYSNNGPTSISVGEYSSVEEFKEQYNAKPEKDRFNFSQEQRLLTTPEQDQKMKTKALELAGTTIEKVREENGYSVVSHPDGKLYGVLTNNCSQHVAEIAKAGDQHLTNSLIPRLQVLVSPETYKQIQANEIIRSTLW